MRHQGRLSSTRTVTIRAIGKLWMPGLDTSWERSYRVGSGPFEHEITSLADAEHLLTVDSGDLSTIDDYEVVYTIRRAYNLPGVIGTITHYRTKVARAWQNGSDSEMAFESLSSPALED